MEKELSGAGHRDGLAAGGCIAVPGLIIQGQGESPAF